MTLDIYVLRTIVNVPFNFPLYIILIDMRLKFGDL